MCLSRDMMQTKLESWYLFMSYYEFSFSFILFQEELISKKLVVGHKENKILAFVFCMSRFMENKFET